MYLQMFHYRHGSVAQMTEVVTLIHAHVHPTMAMVHVNAVFMTGLVPHQDHPDVMKGVIHLE